VVVVVVDVGVEVVVVVVDPVGAPTAGVTGSKGSARAPIPTARTTMRPRRVIVLLPAVTMPER
jgi:hypothetical protein